MICSNCNEELFKGDELKCFKCNKYFHFSCVGFNEVAFRTMLYVLRVTWTCFNCDSVGSIIENYETLNPFSDAANESLVKSVDFMNKEVHGLKLEMIDTLSELNNLQTENKVIKEQNVKLTQNMLFLSKRLNTLEQNKLENNIEIVGIPEVENENCLQIIKEMASKLRVELTVQHAYRVYSGRNRKNSKIVAIINSQENKQNLMTKARNLKLTANQINTNWSNNNIYITHQLTQSRRNLLYKTRIKARQVGYKFTWFKRSNIFVRKNETSNVIRIDDEKALSKII